MRSSRCSYSDGHHSNVHHSSCQTKHKSAPRRILCTYVAPGRVHTLLCADGFPFARFGTRFMNRPAADIRPCRRSGADVTLCMVDGDVVILDRTRGYVHQLNATASHIWHACDGRHSVDEIAASVSAHFMDAPPNVRDAVMRTLSDLDELGLLVSPSLPNDTVSEEMR